MKTITNILGSICGSAVARSRGAFAVGLLAVLVAGSCADDFDPFNRLQGLRVLAIRTEPVSPLAGETVQIQPLVYAPAGQDVTFEWEWCPLPGDSRDGFPCLVTEQTLADMVGGMTNVPVSVPPFDLGNGVNALFTQTIDEAILRAICNVDGQGVPLPDGATGALANLPFTLNCEFGFPSQLKLTVRSFLNGQLTDELVTVRTFYLRLERQSPRNQNPVLGPAFVVKEAESDQGEIVETLAPLGAEATVAVTRQRINKLRVQIDPANAEPYRGFDAMDNPVEVRENLFLSWFVESGDTDNVRTTWVPEELEFSNLLENEWTPANQMDYPPDESSLVLILRDSREGVSWVRLKAALQLAETSAETQGE